MEFIRNTYNIDSMPNSDISSVRDVFAIIGDKVGIEIGAEAIVDVRVHSSSSDARLGSKGTDGSPLAAPGSIGGKSREIFVRFAFAELSTLLLQRS